MKPIVLALCVLFVPACDRTPVPPRTLVQEVIDAERLTDPRVIQCLLPALTTDPEDPRVVAALAAARGRGGHFMDAADYLKKIGEVGPTLAGRLANGTVPEAARVQARLCVIASRPVPAYGELGQVDDALSRLFLDALRGVVRYAEVREQREDGTWGRVERQVAAMPPMSSRTFHDGRPLAEGLLDLYRPCWSVVPKGPRTDPPRLASRAQPPRPPLPYLHEVETVIAVLGDLQGFFETGEPTFPLPAAVWATGLSSSAARAHEQTFLFIQGAARCEDGRIKVDPMAPSEVSVAMDDEDRTLIYAYPLAPPTVDGEVPATDAVLLDARSSAGPGELTLTWAIDGRVTVDERVATVPRTGMRCGTGDRGPTLLAVTPWAEEAWIFPGAGRRWQFMEE